MTYTQSRLPSLTVGSFGISGSETQKALEIDVFKELVNKIAWAVGTTYGRPYATRRDVARQLAVDLATTVVVEKGWPHSIQKK